ncbi:membrane protein [Pseudohongiella spirulinae]|uniref:Membrane protein n=2 Tax=Pseudohongiella spirulinae TaxID=1249552 RepID=A0A0S2KDH0_9GAMM|nr:membrane protein [Pseudohongiella spirulinae]
MTLPGIVSAQQAGDWLVRVGAATVAPDESSKVLTTQATGPLAGTGVGVNNNTQVGLNVVYMMSDHLGLELLAATPFEHDLSVDGLSQYNFMTTDLGSTKHLPPTVSALYYFNGPAARLRVYAGAGLNFTTFFSEKLSPQARTELAADRLKLDDSWGWSASVGADFRFDDTWTISGAVRRLDISTDASLDSALGRITTSVDIDPWVYMLSVGFMF